MQLENRKQQILKVIVDEYIATGEPVGSKSLVQKYPMQVSAATVRNTMAELETEGYLEQPHTSAGRIPSDRGYRKYVDELMQVPLAPAPWQEAIEAGLTGEFARTSTLVKRASELLSQAVRPPA